MGVPTIMRHILPDLRLALRTFAKSPVFTAVALISLAIGIGANTAIFTLMDQVLLRALPVQDPEALVLLSWQGSHYGSNWGMNSLSYPMYRDFQDHNEVFSGMFCRFPTWVNLTVAGQAGFTGPVQLAVSGVPRGASAVFTPAFVAGSGSSTLTVQAGTTKGTFTLTITGTSGSLQHATRVKLQVTK